VAGGRKKRGGHEDEHPDERWLLTYADMITLLMALFMVLFSISSVNTSKFESLQKSLQDAFSGRIIPGGQSIAQSGAQSTTPEVKVSAPVQSLREQMSEAQGRSKTVAEEERDLRALKAAIDAWSAAHGLARKVETRIDARGLTVRLLTDDLLFASGSAELQPQAGPLMRRLGQLLRTEGTHPIAVEGHTDSVPVSGRHPSNWELSGDRASAVVRALARHGVSPVRMSAVGHAFYDPIATNATARGRSQNRRVEILVPRTAKTP
jgi:chemotaxis protein MotB